VLFKDGVVAGEQPGPAVEFSISGPGTYRIEAYLDSLPAPVRGQPWIISNPIYVEVAPSIGATSTIHSAKKPIK
jgi:hypothetical protein